MSEAIMVSSFDGLYDEESEALTCNISNRKFCLHHHFINASLHWDKDNWHLDISSNGDLTEPKWGLGYGGIRYCENCKLIDCIHLFEDQKTYKIQRSPYYCVSAVIATCKICKRRIYRTGCGESSSSGDGWRVIFDVCDELGKPKPCVDTQNYGSGWFCELPAAVSQIFDRDGEQAAREYVRECLNAGSSESARHIIGA